MFAKRDRFIIEFKNFYLQPLKIQNGQIHGYCINMYGNIHQNEKGYENNRKTDCFAHTRNKCRLDRSITLG